MSGNILGLPIIFSYAETPHYPGEIIIISAPHNDISFDLLSIQAKLDWLAKNNRLGMITNIRVPDDPGGA